MDRETRPAPPPREYTVVDLSEGKSLSYVDTSVASPYPGVGGLPPVTASVEGAAPPPGSGNGGQGATPAAAQPSPPSSSE